jgi:hypothetical protein
LKSVFSKARDEQGAAIQLTALQLQNLLRAANHFLYTHADAADRSTEPSLQTGT